MSIFTRSTTSGSLAAFSIKVVPSANIPSVPDDVSFALDLRLPKSFEVVVEQDDVLKELINIIIDRVGIDKEITQSLVDFVHYKIHNDNKESTAKGLLEVGRLILKENDRSLLANIAISNIEVFDGVGGGEYINKIYEPYLLSINPEILEENLNIKLNKVELGITPEEYRDTDIDFFIGTSGGGFEILQQYFITKPCSDDRNTCQYFRVDTDTVLNFLQIFFQLVGNMPRK